MQSITFSWVATDTYFEKLYLYLHSEHGPVWKGILHAPDFWYGDINGKTLSEFHVSIGSRSKSIKWMVSIYTHVRRKYNKGMESEMGPRKCTKKEPRVLFNRTTMWRAPVTLCYILFVQRSIQILEKISIRYANHKLTIYICLKKCWERRKKAKCQRRRFFLIPFVAHFGDLKVHRSSQLSSCSQSQLFVTSLQYHIFALHGLHGTYEKYFHICTKFVLSWGQQVLNYNFIYFRILVS